MNQCLKQLESDASPMTAEDNELQYTRLQLVKYLGEEQAETILSNCLSRGCLTNIQSPQDLYVFAQSLCEYGGLIEVIARSLKTRAILHGAKVKKVKF